MDRLDESGEGPAPGAGDGGSPRRADRSPLAVVCATNDAFAHSAAAMLHSVAAHLPGGSRLRVFVLDDGIGGESRSRLERVAARFAIPTELVWVEPDVASVAGFRVLPGLPYVAYLRLQVGRLLPASLERVLYLDTDMIVRADLSELWETPLQGHAIGAVQNHVPSTVEEPEGINAYWELGIDPSAPYFNSGLMLIDLARWREEEIEERTLDHIRTRPDDLYFLDQGALNAALA